MYAKYGSMDDAWTVFNKMPFQIVVTWSTILGGCAMHGHGKEALKYFEQMCEEGVQPNDIVFDGESDTRWGFWGFSSSYILRKKCKVSPDFEQGMVVRNIQGCLKNSTSITYYWLSPFGHQIFGKTKHCLLELQKIMASF